MTSEPLAPTLRSWLKSTEATPADARRSADKIDGSCGTGPSAKLLVAAAHLPASLFQAAIDAGLAAPAHTDPSHL